MRPEREHLEERETFDPRVHAALADLETRIQQRYPTATFSVARGQDDPAAIHLTAVVDVEDPDEVLDLVSERVLGLQLDEGLPIYVIPLRTPARRARLVSPPSLPHPLPTATL